VASGINHKIGELRVSPDKASHVRTVRNDFPIMSTRLRESGAGELFGDSPATEFLRNKGMLNDELV
jgi:hypothetical protein